MATIHGQAFLKDAIEFPNHEQSRIDKQKAACAAFYHRDCGGSDMKYPAPPLRKLNGQTQFPAHCFNIAFKRCQLNIVAALFNLGDGRLADEKCLRRARNRAQSHRLAERPQRL